MDTKLTETYAALFVLLAICCLAAGTGAGKDVFLPVCTGILGWLTKAATDGK
jgi:hypothetical protein